MAELTSAMPTAAGVYHWSAALAGPKYSRPVGFLTGYFNMLGWTLGLASLYSVAGLQVTGLYQLYHPQYVSQPWHVFVVFVVLNWSFAAFIQFGNKILPYYTKFGCMASLLTSLPARKKPLLTQTQYSLTSAPGSPSLYASQFFPNRIRRAPSYGPNIQTLRVGQRA